MKLVTSCPSGNEIPPAHHHRFLHFFMDVSMGILTMLFNRQIIKYLGTNALSVYGVIVNISTIVQCCAYGVEQAAQPIFPLITVPGISAGSRETLKYALYSTAFFSFLWTLLIFAFPNGFISIFMAPTEEILKNCPVYYEKLWYFFPSAAVEYFSTYYFQSLMKTSASFLFPFPEDWCSVAFSFIYCHC